MGDATNVGWINEALDLIMWGNIIIQTSVFCGINVCTMEANNRRFQHRWLNSVGLHVFINRSCESTSALSALLVDLDNECMS